MAERPTLINALHKLANKIRRRHQLNPDSHQLNPHSVESLFDFLKGKYPERGDIVVLPEENDPPAET